MNQRHRIDRLMDKGDCVGARRQIGSYLTVCHGLPIEIEALRRSCAADLERTEAEVHPIRPGDPGIAVGPENGDSPG